jgi:hypothetical protein
VHNADLTKLPKYPATHEKIAQSKKQKEREKKKIKT